MGPVSRRGRDLAPLRGDSRRSSAQRTRVPDSGSARPLPRRRASLGQRTADRGPGRLVRAAQAAGCRPARAAAPRRPGPSARCRRPGCDRPAPVAAEPTGPQRSGGDSRAEVACAGPSLSTDSRQGGRVEERRERSGSKLGARTADRARQHGDRDQAAQRGQGIGHTGNS